MASGTTIANLKLIFGADTDDLKKKAKEAKGSVKDFESTVDGATDSIARMFGVDTAAVNKMTSSLRGLGETLKNSANEGTASFGKLLSSINGASAAIAGLGISAAVAAFRSLNEEAEYFKSTVAGANIEMMTAAYVNTFSAVLHDMNFATGKAVAEAGANLKKTFSSLWEITKEAFNETLTGAYPAGFASNYMLQLPKGIVATEIAGKAEKIAAEQYEIQKKLNEETARQARLDAEISELKRIANDSEASYAERTAAVSRATELIKEKYDGPDGLVALNQRMADLMKEMKGLTNDTESAVKAYNAQQAKSDAIIRQRNDELRTTQKLQDRVNKQASAEAEERRKAREELEAQVAAHEQLMAQVAGVTSFDLSTSGNLAGLLPKGITGPDGAIEVKFKPVIDETATLELTDQLVSLAENMSSAIGGLVGDLITGGDAWGNFRTAALSAFADMAISVGKLAVATGVATAGIKTALESLNPYVAIAAGAALIALGSAVKAGLRNAASGDYSAASASVASSGYGSQRTPSDAWTARALTIQVEGKLVGDGDQLTAVINNVDRRNSHTT